MKITRRPMSGSSSAYKVLAGSWLNALTMCAPGRCCALVVSITVLPVQSGRDLPNCSTAPKGMAMKMTSLCDARCRGTA